MFVKDGRHDRFAMSSEGVAADNGFVIGKAATSMMHFFSTIG